MDTEIKERGYLNEDGEANVGTSAIFSRLIQEAGRWCEHYASDILVDIDCVRQYLKKPVQNVEKVWRFGFRKNGVDHAGWIDANLKDDSRKYHFYRSIYMLTVATTKTNVTMTLTRVD